MTTLYGAQGVAAMGLQHLCPQIDRTILNRRRIGTAVQNGRNPHTRRHQLARGHPGGVVVGIKRDAATRGDTVAVQIGLHRARHHDSGPIVQRKGDGPFQRPGGQNRAAGVDPPKTLARQMGIGGQMQANPFQRAKHTVVIGTGDGGAWHQTDIGQAGQFGQTCLGPSQGGLTVDTAVTGQQFAPHAEILVGQDHIGPGTRSGQRSHQTSWTSANDQQIATGPSFFIGGGIWVGRQPPQTRRAPDHRFIQLFPKAARPHEGFVVESGG